MILDIIKRIANIKDLRKKIIATLLLVLVYKFLSVIPIPGVNTDGISALVQGQRGLSFFSSLLWGGLENFSVILMGLSPYINAVIIIQLLWVIIPKIGEVVLKDKDSYQYLVESIRKFPDQEKFKEMILAAGFKNAKFKNLTFGVSAIHSGVK